MNLPSKRKKVASLKAELIDPVNEKPQKKTQTEIKRERRKVVNEKTKGLLKRNPTYDQLAKLLEKILFKQDALLRDREKLAKLESDIAFFHELIDKNPIPDWVKATFITGSIELHNTETVVSKVVEKAMALQIRATASQGSKTKSDNVFYRLEKVKGLFLGNEKWCDSTDSSSNIAKHMVKRYGAKEVGSHDSLMRNISQWRKLPKYKK